MPLRSSINRVGSAGVLVALLCAILLVVLARSVVSEFSRNFKLRKELVKLERELTQLEGNASTLQAQLTSLERPFGIEREARMKYGLRKEGEKVLIVDQKSNIKDQKSERDEVAAGTGALANAKAWWKYFANQRSEVGSQRSE